jgi:hypothetical protein
MQPSKVCSSSDTVANSSTHVTGRGAMFFLFFFRRFFLGSVSQLRLKKADIVSFETLGAKHAQFSVRGALEHRSSQPVGI